MRVIAMFLVIALLSVGCADSDFSSSAPSARPSETPATSPAAAPSNPTATAEGTAASTPGPTAVTSGGCPTHSPLSVAEYNSAVEADAGCFTDSDVTLIGWAGTWPEGIGWLGPGIEPGWLALSTAAIWTEKCPRSSEGCGDILSVHIDPDSGIAWRQDGRWLVITGHTRDPRADTCQPDPPDNGISTSDARKMCRGSFVLTSVRNASAALRSDSFARIVIPELNVRARPSTSAPVLEEGHADAPPTKVRFGTASRIDDLYVLDGPVKADGYRWWLVSPTEYLSFDTAGDLITMADPIPSSSSTGWVAEGEGQDAWLIPAENPCPQPPVETAEVTSKVASWAVRLGCFRGQTLTFRGWSDGGAAIFPVKRTWEDPDNHDRLDIRVFPSTLALPAPGQWLEITGQFDHPSSTTCPEYDLLECRSTFTATQLGALGP
jgi:hypothetical protein